MSRFRFIAAERARHSVAILCRVLGVSPSGYYAWRNRPRSERARRDEDLTERIRVIHAGSRATYGAPRVRAALAHAGQRASRKRVARLMRAAGLAGCRPRASRRTTVADPAARAADLVKRDFAPAAPDRLWVADITYVATDEGWLYLAVLLDAFSRRVVGWAMAEHLRTELPLEALRMALGTRRPGASLVHHSDRGCQYAAAAYAEALAPHDVARSMGRPGTCRDNAVAESFFATLKTELLHRRRWHSRRATRTAIFEYIEGFYNRRRLHSTLGYLSPAEYEARHLAARDAA